MIGTIIENYRIQSVLGEGGMGIVYKAWDLKLERYVAIKILSSHALKNPKFIERFKREAKNQAKLNHPNIVSVYGFAQTPTTLGIVMEYVEGETVENLITRKGKLEPLEALKVIKQVLIGVGYAHSKGFIHRDIKPSNIIVNNEGVVKLMDFGISKSINEERDLTKTGVKIGTVLYMSPEQIRAMEPTNQSDIYSIGISFYEMLCGKTPFDYYTEYEILEAHLKKNPERISLKNNSLRPEFDAIISKALNKSLAKRYKSAEEFRGDIDILLENMKSPKSIKKIKKTKKTIETGKKHLKIKFYLLLIVFVAVFAGLFYFVFQSVSQFWQTPNTVRLFNKDNSQPQYYNLVKSSWKKLNAGTFNQLNGISFINDSIGFVCGNQGVVLKTEDAGNNWKKLNDSSEINLFGINFISSDKGFMVGEKGTLLFTSDTGKTWIRLKTGVAESLFNITFLPNEMKGFIAGGNGTILKTIDGGMHWNKVSTPTSELLFKIYFINNHAGFAVGWNGTILTTNDKGSNWSLIKSKTQQYLRDIDFYKSRIGLIVGGNGEILRTDNGGDDWKIISTKTIAGLYAVKFLDMDHAIILSSKGEILTSNDKGKTWNITNSGNYAALTDLTVTPSGRIFITGYNGTLLTN